ncbi:hypothetical protein VKT23_008647 [Stygiomarasmius scandens]|uniref:Uncharacterized protein n=1 Tax=Marasmiellus scandens TaxID=2682957 RepID=A0ABR1JLP4_9AGAR
MSPWVSEFSEALHQAATALRILSDIYDQKSFPGESVEQEWYYVETDMQPPPLDPPVPPTCPSTPTLPLTPNLPTTPLPAAPTCPSAQTYGCIYCSKLL